VVPAVPLNVLVGLDGVVMDPPDPLTMLHDPVPTEGALPARVGTGQSAHGRSVWSDPALDTVGFLLKVIVTSSVEAVQGELLIVQRKT